MAVINFSMDYLSLYITAKIMHIKQKGKRLTLAATIGALYSVVIIALNLASAPTTVLSLLISAVMTRTAYGKQKISFFAKNTVVFYIVSFALGGGITAVCNMLNIWQNSRGIVINGTFDTLYGDLPFGLLLIVALFCGLFSYISGRIIKNSSAKKVCELEIGIKKNNICLQALVDSGNLLKEPISGKPVIIIAFEEIRSILPMDIFNFLKNKDINISDISLQNARIRFIPTTTVGGQGLLHAFCPDYIKINKSDVDAYIAIDQSQKNFGEYTAIVPYTLIQ